MDIKVYPGRLSGIVAAPPSKSVAHRVLICAALADGTSRITGISGSKDMDATIGCLRALGAEILREGSDVTVRGIMTGAADCCGAGTAGSATGETDATPATLDCIESGSTVRFLLPVAAALGRNAGFTGRGKLPERPMSPLADQMKLKGITFGPDGRDHLPFTISGQLQPGVYEIPGNVSSQYISGLLFALPLLPGDSEIRIIGELQSVGYIDLTLGSLRDFGIRVERTETGFAVPGGQTYRACSTAVEGDHSNGAFWYAAAALGSDLEITGLRADSAQGDRVAADIINSMRRDANGRDGGQAANGRDPRRGEAGRNGFDREIDCGNIPDLVPILSVAAAGMEGTTRFYNAGRLRIKESDRLAAMADCLGRLGVTVREEPEELIVTGGGLRGGCTVEGCNDHRIVMSMAIAALSCSEPVVITDAEAVAKSYPDFFDEFRRLGGRADVISSGK